MSTSTPREWKVCAEPQSAWPAPVGPKCRRLASAGRGREIQNHGSANNGDLEKMLCVKNSYVFVFAVDRRRQNVCLQTVDPFKLKHVRNLILSARHCQTVTVFDCRVGPKAFVPYLGNSLFDVCSFMFAFSPNASVFKLSQNRAT